MKRSSDSADNKAYRGAQVNRHVSSSDDPAKRARFFSCQTTKVGESYPAVRALDPVTSGSPTPRTHEERGGVGRVGDKGVGSCSWIGTRETQRSAQGCSAERVWLSQDPRRSCRPEVEVLEDRLVPTGPSPNNPIIILPGQSSSPPAGALTPAQIRHAYGIDQVSFDGISGNGAGQTIAIIDVGDNPGFLNSTDPNFDTSDLHNFDEQFGLPDPPSFIKLNQKGEQGNYPPPNMSSFGEEEALDIEWSHVIAPAANIILIEADTTATNPIY